MTPHGRQLNIMISLDRSYLANRQWVRDAVPAPEPGFERMKYLARQAEDMLLDGIFLPDFMGVNRAMIHRDRVSPFEPLTLLAAIGAVTEHIGVAGTASTLYSAPYNLARQFGSLDHITNGRSGWNIVTSFTGEKNFGMELPAPDERYAMAQEFLEVAKKLWDSWEDGAIVADQTTEIYVDSSKVHDIGHHGTYFNVAGALDVSTLPQRYPVMFQAGASEAGLQFAARNAEGVFAQLPTYEDGVIYSKDLRRRAAEFGRGPESIKVYPGLKIVLGETMEEAWAKTRDWYITPQRLDKTLSMIEVEFPQVRLRDLDRSKPVPAELFPSDEEIEQLPGRRSRIKTYKRLALDTFQTAGAFYDHVAAAYAHTLFVGTPDDVADEMGRWLEGRACDGFIITEGEPLKVLAKELIPRLQERGLFRTEYTGRTFRENLGFGAL